MDLKSRLAMNRNAYVRNIPRLHVTASYGGTKLGIYANVSMYYGGDSRINSVEPTGYIYAMNGSLAADPAPYIAKQEGNNSSVAIAKYVPKFTRKQLFGATKTITTVYKLYVTGSGYYADVYQY